MTTGPNQLRSSRLQQLCRDSVLRPPHSNITFHDFPGSAPASKGTRSTTFILKDTGHPAQPENGQILGQFWFQSAHMYPFASSCHSDEETRSNEKNPDILTRSGAGQCKGPKNDEDLAGQKHRMAVPSGMGTQKCSTFW